MYFLQFGQVCLMSRQAVMQHGSQHSGQKTKNKTIQTSQVNIPFDSLVFVNTCSIKKTQQSKRICEFESNFKEFSYHGNADIEDLRGGRTILD